MTTREIDERIAAALELRAKHCDAKSFEATAKLDRAVAAELLAAKPASEPATHDSGWHHTTMRDADKPAPPPSLVERFKAWHMGRHDDCLHCDVSDALEAAQADTRRLALIEAAAAEVVAAQCRNVAVTLDKIDALAATMERKP